MIGDFLTDLTFLKCTIWWSTEYTLHGSIQADIWHSVGRDTIEETGIKDDN